MFNVFTNMPVLSYHDTAILQHLINSSPEMFYTNKTDFFISEMKRYIKEGRVWRNSIMGETRAGKTEVGCTEAFLYTQFYNRFNKEGFFKNVLLEGSGLKITSIDFINKFLCSDPMDYQYKLKEEYKSGKLRLGQIWIIDESKKSIGGLGSMSEMIELENINDICAKYIQSEIWITPRRFETRNSPYGLYVYQKDIKNRVNWCLLYKIQASAKIGSMYTFLGWVCFPLHTNTKFRQNYEKEKNKRISDVLSGKQGSRTNLRIEIAKKLCTDIVFSSRTPSGKQFLLSIQEQYAYIDRFLVKHKYQDFNQAEKFSIVSDARAMIKEQDIMDGLS